MTFQAVKCDVCSKIKGESNHWLKYTIHANPPGLYVGPNGNKDACSTECILKIVDQIITEIRAYESNMAL